MGEGEAYKHKGEESERKMWSMEKQSFLCLCCTESTLVIFINYINIFTFINIYL